MVPMSDAEHSAPTEGPGAESALTSCVLTSLADGLLRDAIETTLRAEPRTRANLFEQMLRLRTLNRFSARIPSLAEAPNVSPFFMYLEFRELLGELTALHPDRDVFDVPPYDHDNPYLVFAELSSKIRSLLRGAVAPMFMKVPFTKTAGLYTAVFE